MTDNTFNKTLPIKGSFHEVVLADADKKRFPQLANGRLFLYSGEHPLNGDNGAMKALTSLTDAAQIVAHPYLQTNDGYIPMQVFSERTM
jgi:hypothetical protein